MPAILGRILCHFLCDLTSFGRIVSEVVGCEKIWVDDPQYRLCAFLGQYIDAVRLGKAESDDTDEVSTLSDVERDRGLLASLAELAAERRDRRERASDGSQLIRERVLPRS